MEGLTCGRIVHYVVAHEPGEDGMIYSELPGMVLKAKEDGKADLKVFACCDDGDIYVPNVPYDPWLTSRTWHWPERA